MLREVIEVAPALIKAEDKWHVSAWICEYGPPVVRFEDIEQALQTPVPGLSQRANRMLRWVRDTFPPGEKFTFDESGIFPLIEHERNSGAFSTQVLPHVAQAVDEHRLE